VAYESLLNIKEVAEYLQVETATLYHWSKQGKIPAMKVGALWRYRQSDIDEWLEGQKTRPIDTAQRP